MSMVNWRRRAIALTVVSVALVASFLGGYKYGRIRQRAHYQHRASLVAAAKPTPVASAGTAEEVTAPDPTNASTAEPPTAAVAPAVQTAEVPPAAVPAAHLTPE